MRRIDFLRRLGLITGAVITAPMLADELFKEENILDKMISQIPKQMLGEELTFTVSPDIYDKHQNLFVNDYYRGYKVESTKLAPKDNAVLTKGSLFF